MTSKARKSRFFVGLSRKIKTLSWSDRATTKIEPQKDGSIIFSAEVAGTDEVRHWVLSWGKSAEVISPEFLRREIAQELSDCLGKYAPETVEAERV